LALVASLKEFSGQKNVALVGGVALNSVLNGRISRELGFDSVFIPPGPGDEGVAVGCALYGLHRLREREQFELAQRLAGTKVVELADCSSDSISVSDSSSDSSSGGSEEPPNVAKIWQTMSLDAVESEGGGVTGDHMGERTLSLTAEEGKELETIAAANLKAEQAKAAEPVPFSQVRTRAEIAQYHIFR
jgi:hypothetical protein